MYLTQKGKAKVSAFIREARAKRKEILDAKLDTADETALPTEEDILNDIEWFGTDRDGEYINGWGITDSPGYDLPLCLKKGEDFAEKEAA